MHAGAGAGDDVLDRRASGDLDEHAPKIFLQGFAGPGTPSGELVADLVGYVTYGDRNTDRCNLAAMLRKCRWNREVAEPDRSPPKSPEPSRLVFRYRLADGHVEPVTETSRNPTSVAWTTDRRSLTLARPAKASTGEETARAEWWLVSSDREPRKLTADLSAVPAQLFPQEGADAFVGLADGDVVRLDAGEGRCENLTASFEPRIARLAWPGPGVPDGQSFARLVLAVDAERSTAWHSLDLLSGELTPLP